MKQLLFILIGLFIGVSLGFFGQRVYSQLMTKNTSPETSTTVTELTPPVTEITEEVISSWPKADSLVYSPLKVSGLAKGPWFWEGSFTVAVYSSTDKLLGTGIVQAQADAYTEGLVPFEGSVDFAVPAGVESGYVLYENGNASGLPENSKTVKVPVRFN